MNKQQLIRLVSFCVYILSQGLIFQHLNLYGLSFCFIYICFIIVLPVNTDVITVLLIGFAIGLGVDVFYDSIGMHTAATVCLAFFRNYWLMILTPQGGYDLDAKPTLKAYGLEWFIFYTLPLIFIHHGVLLYIEASNILLFWNVLLKIILSSVFTLCIILFLQLIFYNKSVK